MQLSQPLSKHGIERRRGFAREYGALLEEIPGVLNVTWFSNEAHFQLNSYTKKQLTKVLSNFVLLLPKFVILGDMT
jgi:hypothetical protein